VTPEQISTINELHLACMRLSKALIVAGRKLGDALLTIYDDIPITADGNPDADEAKWAKIIEKQFGIPPDIAMLFTDFSILAEVKAAHALPAQAMALKDALSLLVFLIPDVPEVPEEETG
jgi:hypothetical protein